MPNVTGANLQAAIEKLRFGSALGTQSLSERTDETTLITNVSGSDVSLTDPHAITRHASLQARSRFDEDRDPVIICHDDGMIVESQVADSDGYAISANDRFRSDCEDPLSASHIGDGNHSRRGKTHDLALVHRLGKRW
jgi:hypothetical protein